MAAGYNEPSLRCHFTKRKGAHVENMKETLYLAILNKSDFKGFYTRLFLFPEGVFSSDIDPTWYYLNRIDPLGCLDKVVKFEDFFDPEQKHQFLASDFNTAMIVQCAWCKKFKTSSPEGDTWTVLEELAWRRLYSVITHGICPSCAEHAFPRKA